MACVENSAQFAVDDNVKGMTLGNVRSTSSDSGVSMDCDTNCKDSKSSVASVCDVTLSLTSTLVISNGNCRKGIDDVLPATSLMSWTRDVPVQLRMADSGPLAEKPITVMTVLRLTAEKYPNHPALASKVDGVWQKISYREYHEYVQLAAKGFIKLGLEMYHGVGIIGFNSAEWFISDLAAIFAGGFATGIYTTNSPDACRYVADNAQCNIIVVENDLQLRKILEVWDQLPHLKAVIQYRGTPSTDHQDVYSWHQLIEFGRQVDSKVLEDRMLQQAPNKCCTLIYTSGTTGNPKGVMLSHDNLTWTAKLAGRQAKLNDRTEEVISYLPLSHVAAQILDIYIPVIFAATVYFAQPDALKGSLGETLKEVRPTAFLGVPRVWEKMQEKMQAVGRSQGTLKRRIAIWAKGIGLKGNQVLMNRGTSLPFGWTVANAVVFRKVRQALGFDRCKMCMTAAAPIMRDTLDFFASLNIPILEIYGMSESSGPHTLSLPWNYRIPSVGMEISGFTTKLADSDSSGNGEVCMNGRHIFMGYLNSEEKTHEALDDEGWLHSGDIGRRDERGFLYITGRIKELLITAGGENVAPVPIEDAVKENLPCVSNCMLIGDARKFLSVLLTLKTEIDEQTSEPTSKLSRATREFFAAAGCTVSDISELTSSVPDENAIRAIQKGIDAANRKAVSRAQVIQKWTMLPRDFTIAGGELGPTLKLKRPVVTKMYEQTIESLYSDANTD
jgi:long-chain-fatty-acid--CoA ligase ACSBG